VSESEPQHFGMIVRLSVLGFAALTPTYICSETSGSFCFFEMNYPAASGGEFDPKIKMCLPYLRTGV
jgi:hypothetical protein